MTDRQNVVLLTVDSFRTDRCGFLGGEADLTPAMDQLAEDGLVFENAIAPAGATSGSSSTFFTGRYPIERSTAADRKAEMRQNLTASRTLPQQFKDMGYRTAGFTANPWTSRFFGYDTGFDYFQDFMESDLTSDSIKNGAQGGAVSGLISQLLNWWQGQDMYMSWDSYADEIRAWLDEARQDDEPFFLWVFLVDPHMPYLPPKGYRSQLSPAAYAANAWLFGGASQESPLSDWFHDRLLQAYDDTVRFTDTFVDRLSSKIGDDTVLCIHGDHGESFGEHDDYYGHGYLYEETIRVPLVVTNQPADRIERPFSLAELPELLTTIAKGEPVDDSITRPVVTSRNAHDWRVVHGGSWKYTQTADTESVGWSAGEPIECEKLIELGRRVTDHRKEFEDERRRIIDASSELIESANI